MISVIKGNVLTAFQRGDIQVLAHGCNCSGGFGTGVAGQIAQMWPGVKRAYHLHHKSAKCKLGDVQLVRVEPHGSIANCFTQQKYGKGEKGTIVYADYTAIELCMAYLKYKIPSEFRIGIPKIGCGKAGGSWQTVEEILTRIFHDRDLVVYYP